ncbi:MAG: Hsp20/alpha crystallin family protein [Candidatus Methanomethyliaceae archaeon]|nr:Hsp20/alpha crystallin family protein [Candidatus Methanomethyliaceae archaeon]MDW7971004.1 Hsp20/alpha crystallin family protein [Nitrososphaerota archaeon]
MVKKERIPLLPDTCFYHDEEKYVFEIELPGVTKENINLEVTERSLCLCAPRNEVEYNGCWFLVHEVKPEKAKAHFKNGLLTVEIPLAKPMRGVKVPIE